MKLFTLDEANELLPAIVPILKEIRVRHRQISALKESAVSAATSAESGGGGGMQSGTIYVNSLFKLGQLTNDLDQMGVQLKDYAKGLIDFPSMRDGQIVLFCWQLGEGYEIEWWHEMEAGFAGRQRL